MKILRLIEAAVERNFGQLEEEKKRSIFIIQIVNLLMLLVLSSWVSISLYLGAYEMVWLDGICFLLFLTAFLIIYSTPINVEFSFVIIVIAGFSATAVPVLFYGTDTLFIIHPLLIPLAGTLMFTSQEVGRFYKYTSCTFLLYVFLVVWGFKVEPFYNLPEDVLNFFNVFITINSMAVTLFFVSYFYIEDSKYKNLLIVEEKKSDRLLKSIFPSEIAEQLRDSNESLAFNHQEVTVLFADIVGFTAFANRVSPNELVSMLDEVFSEFDAIIDKYDIEKIKTIGDAYMAVCGLPSANENHCQNIADMALEISEIIKAKFTEKYNLKLRIGIQTGRVVAGVIGNKKFSYDLWGDTVNVASRFESSGIPDAIHITEDVKRKLSGDYLFRDAGEVEIKGKGKMRSYFLIGKTRKKLSAVA